MLKLASRSLSITVGSALLLTGLLAVPSTAMAAEATGQVRITEWAYNGSEFVEFTNLDTAAVDLTGWSFSDSETAAGQVDLGSAGTVAPGASFILSQASAADFRAEWALPDSIKVIGDNSTNLGRSDAINLYDSSDALVDSLTYNDAKGAGPRTDTASAWPSTEAVIGTNNAAGWTKSTAGDAEDSWTSTTGIVGSPGISQFGTAVDWLRLNEIETDSSPDWVELINLSPQPLDASGFVLTGRANGVTLTVPAETVIAPGGVSVAENASFKLKKGDMVSLYAPGGEVLLDSYEWGDFHLDTFGRIPNGTGEFVKQDVPSKNELNPAPTDPTDPTDPGDDSGWQSVKLNEVTSANDDPTHDGYELVNTGDVDVDVASWQQSDSTSLPAAIEAPNGTVVPAHGYLVLLSNQGLSSGGDSVKVYRADGSTIVDSVGWGNADAQPGSWSRCADATGAWAHTALASFGSSNATACAGDIIPPSVPGGGETSCQTEAPSGSGPAVAGGIAWPGSESVVFSDNECQFVTPVSGQDVSGLDIDPSAPDVMWAVKNKNHVYRLVKSNELWVPDTTNGWSTGKDIVFPSGGGQPDSEGITVGPDGFLYITTERDNAASGVPLESVLRFDPNEAGAVLHPTSQWDVTASLPEIDPVKADSNLGFEGITWVPDTYLTSNEFIDQSTGAAYDPAGYPGHGTGLYFLALEKNGHLYAYALNANGTFNRISSIDTELPMVQETQWDADAQRIWAVADNSSAGSSTLLKMDAAGTLVVDRTYNRPTGLPDYNNEGFAIAPNSTCVDGVKEVIRADDGNNAGHSLRSGTINCDLELGPQGPNPPAEADLTVVATPSTVQAGGTTTIEASGLEAGTAYTIVLRSDPVTLGEVAADANGELTLANARIPADTTPGAHTITVAAASDPSVVVASTPLTVTAAAVVPPGTSPTPAGVTTKPSGLASTGAQPLPAAAVGALVLMLGAALVIARRRRAASAE